MAIAVMPSRRDAATVTSKGRDRPFSADRLCDQSMSAYEAQRPSPIQIHLARCYLGRLAKPARTIARLQGDQSWRNDSYRA